MKLSIQNAHFYLVNNGVFGSMIAVTPDPIEKECIDNNVTPLKETELFEYLQQGKQVVINPGVNVTAITDQ